jgi:hypothetical protein
LNNIEDIVLCSENGARHIKVIIATMIADSFCPVAAGCDCDSSSDFVAFCSPSASLHHPALDCDCANAWRSHEGCESASENESDEEVGCVMEIDPESDEH